MFTNRLHRDERPCVKLLCAFVFLLLTVSLPIFTVAEDNIKVTLNGAVLAFDVRPQLADGTTLVPMRRIFEALGAEVNWDDTSQTVTATKGDITVVMQLDNPGMLINGNKITLSVPPRLTDGSTLVPTRAVAEGLDAVVDWDSAAQTVVITTKLPEAPPGYKYYADGLFKWSMNIREDWEVVNARENVTLFKRPGGRACIWIGTFQHCSSLELPQKINNELENMKENYSFGNANTKINIAQNLFNGKHMAHIGSFTSVDGDDSFFSRIYMFNYGGQMYKLALFADSDVKSLTDMLGTFEAEYASENLPDNYKEEKEVTLKNKEYGYSVTHPATWAADTANDSRYVLSDPAGLFRMEINCVEFDVIENSPEKLKEIGVGEPNFTSELYFHEPLSVIFDGLRKSTNGIKELLESFYRFNSGQTYHTYPNQVATTDGLYKVAKSTFGMTDFVKTTGNTELIRNQTVSFFEVSDETYDSSKVTEKEYKTLTRVGRYYIVLSKRCCFIIYCTFENGRSYSFNRDVYNNIVGTLVFE